jgi:hypothetical protein
VARDLVLVRESYTVNALQKYIQVSGRNQKMMDHTIPTLGHQGGSYSEKCVFFQLTFVAMIQMLTVYWTQQI